MLAYYQYSNENFIYCTELSESSLKRSRTIFFFSFFLLGSLALAKEQFDLQVEVRCVIKSQLTVTGFGSENSSGHILHRACPNSCVLQSVSERRALLMKLEPFFSLFTRFHLASTG